MKFVCLLALALLVLSTAGCVSTDSHPDAPPGSAPPSAQPSTQLPAACPPDVDPDLFSLFEKYRQVLGQPGQQAQEARPGIKVNPTVSATVTFHPSSPTQASVTLDFGVAAGQFRHYRVHVYDAVTAQPPATQLPTSMTLRETTYASGTQTNIDYTDGQMVKDGEYYYILVETIEEDILIHRRGGAHLAVVVRKNYLYTTQTILDLRWPLWGAE